MYSYVVTFLLCIMMDTMLFHQFQCLLLCLLFWTLLQWLNWFSWQWFRQQLFFSQNVYQFLFNHHTPSFNSIYFHKFFKVFNSILYCAWFLYKRKILNYISFYITTVILLPSDWNDSNLSEITTAYAWVFAGTLALKEALTWISVTCVFSLSLCFFTLKTDIGYRDFVVKLFDLWIRN